VILLETATVNEAMPTEGLPRIGSTAPQFEAPTTHGTLRLSDFKGSWLILFSHPADFTPVCTTEFIAFAQIHGKLQEMNCELSGHQVRHADARREQNRDLLLRVRHRRQAGHPRHDLLPAFHGS
jgi:peroxiredoxin